MDDLFYIPPKADLRDLAAIKRIVEGFVKLLFPHVENANDIAITIFQNTVWNWQRKCAGQSKSSIVLWTPENLSFPANVIYRIYR
ncbi:MAG: BREX system Lon protease-like protein BrxL [Treponema sp.]|nr:BREX system Lon protease-like protein BrxL [Treponema sp.]